MVELYKTVRKHGKVLISRSGMSYKYEMCQMYLPVWAMGLPRSKTYPTKVCLKTQKGLLYMYFYRASYKWKKNETNILLFGLDKLSQHVIYYEPLSNQEALPWRVKSSGVRWSKIIWRSTEYNHLGSDKVISTCNRSVLAGLGGQGLKNYLELTYRNSIARSYLAAIISTHHVITTSVFLDGNTAFGTFL